MKTFDSTLAYYVNQLDNLDKKLYEPLYSTSWGRDIKLRSGITMANESTSFVRSNFARAARSSSAEVFERWLNSPTMRSRPMRSRRAASARKTPCR